MTIISDILSNSTSYTPENTDIDYHKSHLNILLQQLKRKTNIEQSKVWDYIAVENDPFFSRRYPSNNNKISKIMSNVSTYQTALTATLNQLYLAKVYNFIPKNLLDTIKTLSGLADTTNNLLPTISQQIPLQMIEQALLTDLLSYFDNGQATYNDVLSMYSSVLQNAELFQNIQTGDLKSILSLPLKQFLPEEFSVILESLAYLDLLDEIFTTDDDKNSFNLAILNIFKSTESNTVSSYVNPDEFQNYNISYSDPLGITHQDSMMSQMASNIFSSINPQLNSLYSQHNISSQHASNITTSLEQSFSTSIVDPILDSGILLPDLTDCSNTIKANANNDVINSFKNCFVLFQQEIIKRIPEISQQSTSFDYLVNIKNNLELRDRYINTGSSIENLQEIRDYIETNTTSKLSDKQLDDLYIKIKTVLKD